MIKYLAGTAAVALFAGQAIAADVTLRFGHVGNPGSLFEASVNHFAECVNGAEGDAVEVETYCREDHGQAGEQAGDGRAFVLLAFQDGVFHQAPPRMR